FEEALIRPAPDRPVPFLVGGRSDAAVRRSARLAEGWLGVWCSPRRFAEVLGQIAEEAERVGRVGVAWRHAYQVWVGIDDDRERARARLARGMQNLYQIPFERFEKYSPYGTPAEVADFLAPYVEAGCTSFNVMPVCDTPERGIDAVAEIRERLVKD
ncbi:MAG: LLM class flavin-dependent oxidoreductase, partial [Proteobacteria bacterium]|nr:LLM class flavin-dependent oxidoreductase [Pseudomonadota bacterium]